MGPMKNTDAGTADKSQRQPRLAVHGTKSYNSQRRAENGHNASRGWQSMGPLFQDSKSLHSLCHNASRGWQSMGHEQ